MGLANLLYLPLVIALVMPQSSDYAVVNKAKAMENEPGAGDEFAVENGPKFELPSQQQGLVYQVIGEMKGGYGGTLVTSGPDKTLDSAPFLSKYLREFSSVEHDGSAKKYDYVFELILARASEHPTMLDDPRLDWDIYRALLLYEQFSDGTDRYEERTGKDVYIHELDSAKDLAWMYIEHQSDRLMKDKARQRWWVEHLISGLTVPGGARVNRWYLLQLCLLADPSRQQTFPPTDQRKTQMREPSAEDPFLVVQEGTKSPGFKDALHLIAEPLHLSVEVWGIDPGKMPPASILPVSLEMTKWPTDRSHKIGQESWSAPETGTYEYRVQFFHLVGQRAPYSNLSIPADRKDGVFFFSFNKHLYVWPKAEMDGGVLKMARVAGLIDDAVWAKLTSTAGFHQLLTTVATQ
jgi:hypothetical protein